MLGVRAGSRLLRTSRHHKIQESVVTVRDIKIGGMADARGGKHLFDFELVSPICVLDVVVQRFRSNKVMV